MSEQQVVALEKAQQPRAIARVEPAVIARIDEIAGGVLDVFKQRASFALELRMAEAVGDLLEALTPAVMEPVMQLQGTSLGFRTDRDKDGGYPVETVRQCFVEAKLRGYRAVGNEWNIIGGNFFAAKNGVRRKLLDTPGFTDYKPSLEPPRLTTSGEGAVVKARASWKIDGIGDSLEAEIPIRVNRGQGADAILGKAQRRLDVLVLARLEGTTTPAADVDEIEATSAPARVTAPPPAAPAEQGSSPPAPLQKEQQFTDLEHDLAAQLGADIEEAPTPQELAKVADKIVAHRRKGELSDAETTALRRGYDERLRVLKAGAAS
jgi:hypothetical protein